MLGRIKSHFENLEILEQSKYEIFPLLLPHPHILAARKHLNIVLLNVTSDVLTTLICAQEEMQLSCNNTWG